MNAIAALYWTFVGGRRRWNERNLKVEHHAPAFRLASDESGIGHGRVLS
jgi:hypothetical protein